MSHDPSAITHEPTYPKQKNLFNSAGYRNLPTGQNEYVSCSDKHEKSMTFTSQDKENLKKELAETLREEPEVVKVVVFGSFLHASDPHDLDVAVFQDSDQTYLPLAMKYRKKTRMIGRRIPLDIFPLKPGMTANFMLDEIARGETIYER